jgi:hypothetical protein
MNPSVDKDPAPGVMGGAGPGSPNMGRPAPQGTLPIKKEGWGSRIVRWLEAVDRGSVVAWKAFEWGLTIFIGLSWLILALLAMALG